MPIKPIRIGSPLDFGNQQTGQNVPNPTNPGDIANKSWVESVLQQLRAETQGFFAFEEIDCSTNPNYPPTKLNKAYLVTVEGRIGGANGVNVGVGDIIRYKGQFNDDGTLLLDSDGQPVPSPGGTDAAVGNQFYINEGNVLPATTNTAGTVKLATEQEALTGENQSSVITPDVLQKKLNNFAESNLKYVTTIGDGTNNEFDITHPLNTEDIDVIVRDKTTKEQWWVYNKPTGANSVRINFSTPPSNGQFTVIIKS